MCYAWFQGCPNLYRFEQYGCILEESFPVCRQLLPLRDTSVCCPEEYICVLPDAGRRVLISGDADSIGAVGTLAFLPDGLNELRFILESRAAFVGPLDLLEGAGLLVRILDFSEGVLLLGVACAATRVGQFLITRYSKHMVATYWSRLIHPWFGRSSWE